MRVWCTHCATPVFSYRVRAHIDSKDVTVTAKCHDDEDKVVIGPEVERPVIHIAMFDVKNGYLPAPHVRAKMEADDGVGQ